MERGRAPAHALPVFADQLFAQRPGRVYREAVAVLEEALLAHALALTGGNQLRAARLLGLNRNTLRKRGLELGVLPRRSRRPAGRPRSLVAGPGEPGCSDLPFDTVGGKRVWLSEEQ